jgi:glycine betaine/proline transport system substrate-binding protein
VWVAAAAAAGPAAAESVACREVRLADVGWTDVTATTALLSELLRELDYHPVTRLLSVPVTFAAMKSGEIDVFLGSWMPAQAATRAPYLADGSITVLRENLVGAKYTLAVPAYAYAAGLRSFADIGRFAKALDGRIYGIEAGNDGNRIILDMIRRNQYGLGGFTLVPSSEQGMLAEVARRYAARQPVVFLAWDPHPMNLRFELRYLAGGEATFGPDYGGATVATLTRAGYAAACPNVGRLLANLEFSTRGESEVMYRITEGHEPPDVAARAWLAARPGVRAAWLKGVTRFDGSAPEAAASAAPEAPVAPAHLGWVTAEKLPVGATIAGLLERLRADGRPLIESVAWLIETLVGATGRVLRYPPSPLAILALAALAWLLQRRVAIAAFVVAALLFIMNQGYWDPLLDTLALVLVATFLITVLGIPAGIALAHRPRVYRALGPVLDLMQTLPTFVYLIPVLVLFGLGVVPAVVATVIFAIPTPVRLTYLGIRGVPQGLIEVGAAFGATPRQLLLKVELPAAMPLILAGVTQGIMMCLSMVVIGALVGAGGLGVPVVRALNTVQIGMGFESGLAIVLLAILLDRVSRVVRRAA